MKIFTEGVMHHLRIPMYLHLLFVIDNFRHYSEGFIHNHNNDGVVMSLCPKTVLNSQAKTSGKNEFPLENFTRTDCVIT